MNRELEEIEKSLNLIGQMETPNARRLIVETLIKLIQEVKQLKLQIHDKKI